VFEVKRKRIRGANPNTIVFTFLFLVQIKTKRSEKTHFPSSLNRISQIHSRTVEIPLVVVGFVRCCLLGFRNKHLENFLRSFRTCSIYNIITKM
jgi:hypothetical protein